MTSLDLSDPENHDLNPFRGNIFRELVLDEEGKPVEKDSLGYLKTQIVADDTLGFRDNYRKGDVRNFLDGDNKEFVNYGYGEWTLIADSSRVYKGGSWADREYWLDPAQRRYLPEYMATNYIGFRCVSDIVGPMTSKKKKPRNSIR